MRFTPHQGIYAYERTNRKLKAAERRLRLDREKFPLFAAEIAESQPTPEELLDARGRAFVENQQANRDREARNWWRARAELRAIAEPDRAAFIRYWGRCKCPGNACYLLTYINMFRDGRLIVHEGEVRPRSDVEWERDRKAKIAAMSDLELDVMIQTHISPLLAEWGREERRRRAELSAAVPPARSSSMRRKRRGVRSGPKERR